MGQLQPSLFASPARDLPLAEGAWFFPRFALPIADTLVTAVEAIAAQAPFRRMETPGGRRMSVAMTSCGTAGWVTDLAGYRYDGQDPLRNEPWPPFPAVFLDLAARAAVKAGFPGFVPDAGLINRYVPGAQMSLHQDKTEPNLSAPVVSVSLGLPATFLFGGFERSDRPQRLHLEHGDVVVWGGPARLRYHGVLPIKDGAHVIGNIRYNLTFRRAR